MLDLRCPFSSVLLTKDYLCEYAQEVIRRGGGEIACQNTELNTKCIRLADQLRENLLPMLGHENDLLTVPQAMIVKVLHGSVTALKNICEDKQQSNIDSISTLTSKTLELYSDLDDLPYTQLLETVKNTQLKKRRKKKRD